MIELVFLLKGPAGNAAAPFEDRSYAAPAVHQEGDADFLALIVPDC
ncbi:MAG: hypothetical protein WCG92_13615 [Hyphomicrobiales bacterium]